MKRLTLKGIKEIEQRIKSKPSEDNVRVVWQEYLQLADQDIPRLIAEIKRLRAIFNHLIDDDVEGILENIVRGCLRKYKIP